MILLFSKNVFAQSWEQLDYFDKPIPIKFYKTKSSGKIPTVLLVHGTLGVSAREENWGQFLSKNGYNVLIVDLKTGRFTGSSDRHKVNYAALLTFVHRWMQDHPNIDENNITFMGLSLGGFLGFWLDNTGAYRNYILFYPGCYHLLQRREGLVLRERLSPTLLIWGTNDELGEGTYCPQVLNKMSGKVLGKSIPNAGHGFDGELYVASFLDSASPTGRASLVPNKQATDLSRNFVLEFLQLHK